MTRIALAFLILFAVSAIAAPWLATPGYAEQFRESPSSRFPLGAIAAAAMCTPPGLDPAAARSAL